MASAGYISMKGLYAINTRPMYTLGMRVCACVCEVSHIVLHIVASTPKRRGMRVRVYMLMCECVCGCIAF